MHIYIFLCDISHKCSCSQVQCFPGTFNDFLETLLINRHEYFGALFMLIQTPPQLQAPISGEGVLVRRMKGEFLNVKTPVVTTAKKEKVQPVLLMPPAPVAFLKPRKWDYL